MWMRVFLMVLVAGMMGACAGQPYHPLKDGVGFAELPVGTDQYQVTFVGTAGMAPSEARQYALTRASELTVLRGGEAFVITGERITMMVQSQYWPGSTGWDAYGGGGRGRRTYYQPVYEPGHTEVYTVPEAFVQFQLAEARAANAVPAGYLLRQAVEKKWPLSAGVVERIGQLPAGPVALPPAPAPTTKR